MHAPAPVSHTARSRLWITCRWSRWGYPLSRRSGQANMRSVYDNIAAGERAECLLVGLPQCQTLAVIRVGSRMGPWQLPRRRECFHSAAADPGSRAVNEGRTAMRKLRNRICLTLWYRHNSLRERGEYYAGSTRGASLRVLLVSDAGAIVKSRWQAFGGNFVNHCTVA
jgi:hypothetical protein